MSEDKSLSQNLSEHYRAIESEFALNAPTTPVEIAQAKLVGLLSEATQALESILLSSESDAVRMSGIKLVFDYTMGKPGAAQGEDELSKLVQSLTAKGAKVPVTTKDAKDAKDTKAP